MAYMTMSELMFMESMGFSHRTSFRENYFKPALEDYAVELLYPKQTKYPKQKYCLTEAAMGWKCVFFQTKYDMAKDDNVRIH